METWMRSIDQSGKCMNVNKNKLHIWATSSEFGTYRLCEQRRFRRACASAQSRKNLRCSLIKAVSQEEPSDRKSDPWPLWMAGHALLKFVMTECSKTQIRLTGPMYECIHQVYETNGVSCLPVNVWALESDFPTRYASVFRALCWRCNKMFSSCSVLVIHRDKLV